MDDLPVDTVLYELHSDDGGVAFLSSEHAVVGGWDIPGFGTDLTFDIIGDIFTVLDSEGNISWTWSLLDHFNPLDHFTDDLLNFWMMPPYDDIEAPKDWSHGNAMVPNGGSWLGSFRNLDWLCQVNPDTDEIDWILGEGGDFELAEGGMWFSRQHSPQVMPDGNILLYDNGGARAGADPDEAPFTRVVEYSLDEDAGGHRGVVVEGRDRLLLPHRRRHRPARERQPPHHRWGVALGLHRRRDPASSLQRADSRGRRHGVARGHLGG